MDGVSQKTKSSMNSLREAYPPQVHFPSLNVSNIRYRSHIYLHLSSFRVCVLIFVKKNAEDEENPLRNCCGHIFFNFCTQHQKRARQKKGCPKLSLLSSTHTREKRENTKATQTSLSVETHGRASLNRVTPELHRSYTGITPELGWCRDAKFRSVRLSVIR